MQLLVEMPAVRSMAHTGAFLHLLFSPGGSEAHLLILRAYSSSCMSFGWATVRRHRGISVGGSVPASAFGLKRMPVSARQMVRLHICHSLRPNEIQQLPQSSSGKVGRNEIRICKHSPLP